MVLSFIFEMLQQMLLFKHMIVDGHPKLHTQATRSLFVSLSHLGYREEATMSLSTVVRFSSFLSLISILQFCSFLGVASGTEFCGNWRKIKRCFKKRHSSFQVLNRHRSLIHHFGSSISGIRHFHQQALIVQRLQPLQL